MQKNIGKSTFVNVLCCEQNPTGGDITVNGRSVLSDQNLISKMIGECKQDDFLWPNLTAREHLELFAGIRGVRKEEMADTVTRWLESVDLDLVQHTRVSTFSGGMKRRLSVAISTIGNSPIIVLDEPTTGMLKYYANFILFVAMSGWSSHLARTLPSFNLQEWTQLVVVMFGSTYQKLSLDVSFY